MKPALPSVLTAAKPLGDALSFLQVLWAVAHGLESSSKRLHARFGVTGPQRFILRIVGHHGRMSAGELAQVLRVHPSTLTGMLRKLEAAKLVRREPDPFDRRRALLMLTPRGTRLNDRREGTIEAVVARTLAKAPHGRIEAAKTLLVAFASELEKDLTQSRAGGNGPRSV